MKFLAAIACASAFAEVSDNDMLEFYSPEKIEAFNQLSGNMATPIRFKMAREHGKKQMEVLADPVYNRFFTEEICTCEPG